MPATIAKVRFGKPIVLAPNVVAEATTSATLSPDGDELSVLFDDLRAESQAPQGALSDAATVTLEIPLQPPADAKRVRVDLDLRGSLHKTAGAHAVLAVAVGDTLVTRAFELGSTDDRSLTFEVRESMPAHPGGKLVERLLVSIWLAVGRQRADQSALLVIDSLDFSVHAST